MYRQWANALDMVIWLDTSDVTLVERIRTRDRWHRVKEKSAPETCQFLAHWRVAYEQVLSALTAEASGLKVICFDTAQKCLDETVNRALVLFGFSDYEGKTVS